MIFDRKRCGCCDYFRFKIRLEGPRKPNGDKYILNIRGLETVPVCAVTGEVISDSNDICLLYQRPRSKTSATDYILDFIAPAFNRRIRDR